jgi:hypothetical protein
MGWYIQTESNKGKADAIIRDHGAKEVSTLEALEALGEPGVAVVCVVDNQAFGFEAAGFCFNEREFNDFNLPDDPRPRRWLTMDRDKCKKLTGYTGD